MAGFFGVDFLASAALGCDGGEEEGEGKGAAGGGAGGSGGDGGFPMGLCNAERPCPEGQFCFNGICAIGFCEPQISAPGGCEADWECGGLTPVCCELPGTDEKICMNGCL